MASDIKGKISQINGKPLVDIGLRNDIGDLSLVNGTLVDFVNSKPSLGQVRDEIGKVIGDAPEAFDTLKEIADWIGEHGTDFTKLSEKVDTKLDKITSIASYNRLYGVTQSGSQRTYNISKSPQDSAIPQYKSTGQLQVNDPIDSKDVANKQYVLNTAVNKLTTTQKAGSIVYGRSSTGTEEGVNYRSSAEYGYDLVYRDGNGRAQIKDPANDLDISNKKYVDESLEKKVDKVAPGSKWQLYGVGSETTQLPNGATISTTHQALPNTVINRDGNGRAEIESPVTDLNIVNKKYVDTSLKTKLDKVEITSGKYKAYIAGYDSNSNPVQMTLDIDNGDAHDSIMLRDSNGRSQVADGASGKDIVNYSQLETKVDKITNTGFNPKAYVASSIGQLYLDVTYAPANGAIPRYSGNGTLAVKTPIDGDNATPKSYVDAKLSEASPYQEITYSELKDLRDNSKLIKGSTYRIIDYITTVIENDSTKSAGHQFDILVMADSENKLNEDARAIQHSDDTYFSKSKLEAWKLKYCLDNDNIRFSWADTTNGKGVIYEMIDEFNNDLPYDFKNIQFKRYELHNVQYKFGQDEEFSVIPIANISGSDSWYTKNIMFSYSDDEEHYLQPTYLSDAPSQYFYTFSFIKTAGGEATDATLGNTESLMSSDAAMAVNNKLEKFIFATQIGEDLFESQLLNNIVFVNIVAGSFSCYSNIFGPMSYNATIDGSDCYNNIINSEFYDNIIIEGLSGNTIEHDFRNNFLAMSHCTVNSFFKENYGRYRENIIENNVYLNIVCQDNGDLALINNSIISMNTQSNKIRAISNSKIKSYLCKFNQNINNCILNTRNTTYDSNISDKVVSNYEIDGKITSNEYLVKSKSTELTELNLVPKYYMDAKIQELENKIAELTAKIPNITTEDVGE